MRTRLFAVMATVVVALVVATLAMPHSPATLGLPQAGGVGATLATPEGLAIGLVQIEKGSSRWFFRIHLHNAGDHAITVIGSGPEHQFVLAGATTPGTPADEGIVQLTAPAGVDALGHPSLSALLNGGRDAEGWLTADLSSLRYAPRQLLYRYAVVHTTACRNPQDPSTCHPADVYRAVIWNLA